MWFFLERYFDACRSRWWQVFAAVCVGACFGFIGVEKSGLKVSPLPYVLYGGLMGLVAAGILLWVDAGRRCRQLRGDFRPTVRERSLAVCVIVGFGLGALSVLCGIIMGVVQAVAFLRSL